MSDTPPAGRPRKGRGAVSNRAGRFEPYAVEPFDDGWGSLDEAPPRIETTVTEARTRRIVTRNDSPDVPFDRSVNPYQGCEHGCVYCFARPTHSFLGLSPGLDFESRLVAKPEAPERLDAELRRRGYRCATIALGSNTDPYQPIERELRITRRLLETLTRFGHPVAIVTKSNLVLRDLDLLVPLSERRLAHVLVSVTTLDRKLARRMEPRAPTPERRLETIERLAAAGVPAGVLASPMIPGLNDAELEAVLGAAAERGARAAGTIVVRLPRELVALFTEWLETHYPTKAKRVLGRLRDMHGGELYDATWGKRMRGEGPYAELLERRFEVARRRLGLLHGLPPLDTTQFRAPPRSGDQMELF